MWMEWREQQYNRPDRADYYLMQIAHEVVRGYAKYPNQVKMEHFRLKFKTEKKEEEAPALTDAQSSRIMQAKWVAMMGMPVTVMPPVAAPKPPEPSA